MDEQGERAARLEATLVERERELEAIAEEKASALAEAEEKLEAVASVATKEATALEEGRRAETSAGWRSISPRKSPISFAMFASSAVCFAAA